MRTTLVLPDALIEEARTALGYTSKTDTRPPGCAEARFVSLADSATHGRYVVAY